MSRAPGGAVLAAAGIAAEYGGELYPRTCPAMSLTPLLAGEAGISATLESGRTMSWATPVRSHVVVTMMARSITVERSVPALLGLARVSGLGTARHRTVFFLYQGLEVDLQEFWKNLAGPCPYLRLYLPTPRDFFRAQTAASDFCLQPYLGLWPPTAPNSGSVGLGAEPQPGVCGPVCGVRGRAREENFAFFHGLG